MALQVKNYNINGYEYPELYVKIGHLQGKKTINFNVVYYTDKNIADNDQRCNSFLKLNTYNFTPDLDSPDNFIMQCYDYLKTLQEFSDAINI